MHGWTWTLIACLALLAGCRRTPDETVIRQEMASMQEALEARQPRDFMRYVADDFTGNQGSFDREALHNLLRAQVVRNDKINVLLGPADVELQGDRATVKVTATFTGGSGGLLPEKGAVYTITSGWKRDGKEWRVYNGAWEQKL